ncbi:thioredoxin family protein [Acetanaerobacterium elongatum]|uniref:Thioredoxin 1 n=1 Tax=Acetanaerobacterium elongatum TaxID=258515 RepID=A0A1G9XDA6_9FIRM|nr:thioredoxin family protein [Acetanaerobacterium elongatum]SDM94779.1 thioredoxin 1 [Acetanaerobacterium elongatum]
MDSPQKSYKKVPLSVKIIVLVVLVLAVFALWLFKNLPKDSFAASSGLLDSSCTTQPPGGTAASSITSSAQNSPDFALTVTAALDLEQLKSHKLPILIEFGSDGCDPCRQMAPIIEALNKELQGRAIVKFVDVWANPEYAEGYPLTVIPTQLFIDAEGKPYTPKEDRGLGLKLYQTKATGEHVFTTHEGIISKEDLLAILTEMGMQE